MVAPPIPTFVPQDQWYSLTSGGVNPSEADSVPNASYLSPSGGQNGLVGSLDTALVYLAGTLDELDGGQKWLMWVSDSLMTADGVNVFNPYVTVGTPGRWISTTIGQGVGAGTVVTSGASFTIPASQSSIVNVIVNKTVGSATTINLPTLAPGLWQEFRVKDGKRDAGTNAITVSGNGHTIDGAASLVIVVNGGSVAVVWNGTEFNQVA